ncbi:MAG: DoxX family membrane protein [Thiobacillus sp.]|nr:DoxX family membrane protein [Thiobacillus sp.]
MTEATPSTSSPPGWSVLTAIAGKVPGWLDSVPYALLALPLRFAAATVFWRSGQGKLANWDTTLYLFQEEYKVPLLPPDFAAHMAAAVELTTPVLLVCGLASRLSAAVLLGMTAVIQIFVYPMSWPTHIQWAAILLIILCRGPGMLSVDHFLLTQIAPKLGFTRK